MMTFLLNAPGLHMSGLTKEIVDELGPLLQAQYTYPYNSRYDPKGKWLETVPNDSSPFLALGQIGRINQITKRDFMNEYPWISNRESDRFIETPHYDYNAPSRFYARTFDGTHPSTKSAIRLEADKWRDATLHLPLIRSLCPNIDTIVIDGYGGYVNTDRIILHPDGTTGQLTRFGLRGETDELLMDIARRLPGIQWISDGREYDNEDIKRIADIPPTLRGFAIKSDEIHEIELWNCVFVPVSDFSEEFGFGGNGICVYTRK